MTSVLEHAPPIEVEQKPEAPAAGLPYQEYCKDGQLQIVITGLDENVRDFALEAAHASLEETLAERGMRGLLKRIVHGNMLRGHFLLKRAARARKTVEETNNLYHFQGIDAAAYERPILRRFAKDDDTYIHEDAGEYRLRLNQSSRDHQDFRDKVLGLLKAQVLGDERLRDQASFEDVARKLVRTCRDDEHLRQYLGNGRLQANNLWQIAQNVRSIIETNYWNDPNKEQHIDEVLSQANIIIGKAHVGPHSSFTQTRLERLSQTVEGRAFINEVGAVSAVTLAYSLGGLAVQRTLGAMTAAVAPGAVAGLWAGKREGRILDDERTKHGRDMAYGKEAELKGRRKSLANAQYEIIPAVELTAKLRSYYQEDGSRLNFQTSEELMKIVRSIAEYDARTSISRAKGIDLISGTSLGNYEAEREELLYTVEKVRKELRDWLQQTDAETLEQYGLHAKDIKAIKGGDPAGFQEFLGSVSQRYLIEEDVKEKDKAYRSIRKRRIAAMAGIAAVAGASIGIAVQEGIAAVNPRLEGIFEQQGGSKRETFLAALLHKDAIEQPAALIESEPATSTIPINDGLTLNVPESLHVEVRGNLLNITGPDDNAINGLRYNPDNTLTAESLNKLREAGFTVTSSTSDIEMTETAAKALSAKEFIAANPDSVKATAVDFYYTNNTVGADGNESLLQYGGTKGVDSKGNIVVRLGDFGKHESTAGSHHMNPKTAASQNKLWLAVTASKDTQGKTFMVKVDNNGQAVIAKNSSLASLFNTSGGNKHPVFSGHKMQIVEQAGTNKQGATLIRPIASDFGSNKAQFMDTTPAPTSKPLSSVSYTLQYMAPTAHTSAAHNTSQLVALPPIIPLYMRSTLTPANDASTQKPTQTKTETSSTPADPTKNPQEALTVHLPKHTQKQLPPGAHAPSTNIAQSYYNRIIKNNDSLRKAQRQLKAILKKAGLKRRDFTFSKDGKEVYVMREAAISRHVTV